MKKFKRHLVTAALPYANGPIHIGHLAGVYIPADIYCRYLRMKSEDVIFVCGSDEHGVPITIKARQEGVNPQQIVNKYHELIKDSFKEFGISFDIYHRTTSVTHYRTATTFFKTLFDKRIFIEKTTKQYFDTEAGQFLADRYIVGTCPRCGFENAYGDQCEKCGSSLSPDELVHPRSTLSGSKPVLKETLHWYLPLDKYEPFLRKWILEDNKHWKSNVYGQCKSWLDGGLEPRAVTRDLNWGIPVPVQGAEGKVLYVWFDAPIGYISATKALTKKWQLYWKDPETKLIHFIGKDNIVFHCIIFPAMLKAEGTYILPDNVPANEFLNLEGDKISTSRNWAVWLHEYLVDFKDKQDVLRYVLCAAAPETKDNDFTWKDFQARNNNELVAILGNFIHRSIVLTFKYFDGHVPEFKNPDKYDIEVLEEIINIRKQVESNLDNFRFREALKEAMNLARLGNKYLADREPWNLIKTDKEKTGSVLNVALQIAANLSGLIEPFLPDTSRKLVSYLKMSPLKWTEIGNVKILKEGHELREPKLLFEKIEDKVIQEQLDKLTGIKKQNESIAAKLEPAKGVISYDEFNKMDIRIGKILSAEKVPKTDKLLKLTIDTGLDVRTIVSGIAENFKPENLPGKQVSVLANLEPRNIKGIVSHGMILLAEEPGGKFVFIVPEEETQQGSAIK